MKKIILFLLLITSSLFSELITTKNYQGDGVIAGQVSYAGNLHSLYLHNYDNEALSFVRPYINFSDISNFSVTPLFNPSFGSNLMSNLRSKSSDVTNSISNEIARLSGMTTFSDITNFRIKARGGDVFDGVKSQISLLLSSASNSLLHVTVVYRSLGGGEIQCDLKLNNISTEALSFAAGFDIVSTNIVTITASNEAFINLPGQEQLLLQSKLLSLSTNRGELGQVGLTNKLRFKKKLILESGDTLKFSISIRDRKKRDTAIGDKAITWWQRWLKTGLVPPIHQGWLGAKLFESLVVQKAILLNGRSPVDIKCNADPKFPILGQLQIADMFSKYGFYKEAADILNNLAGKLGNPAYPLRTEDYSFKKLALIDSYYSYLVFDNFVRSGKFAGSLKLISKRFLFWNNLQNSEGLFGSDASTVYSTATHLILASGLRFAAKLMALARNRSLAERFLGMSVLTTRGLDSLYSDRLSCYLDIKSKQPLTDLASLYPFLFGTTINKKLSSSGVVVTSRVSRGKLPINAAVLLRYYALQSDLSSFSKAFRGYKFFGRSQFLLATIAATTHSLVLSGSEKWFYNQFKNRFFVLERLSRKLKGLFLYREIKSRLNRLVENKIIKKDLYKLATLFKNLNSKVQNMNFDKFTNSLLKSRVSKLSKEFVAYITSKVAPDFILSKAGELTPFQEKVNLKLSTDNFNSITTNKQSIKIVKPAILDMKKEIKGNQTDFTFSLNKKLNHNQNMLVKLIIAGREKGVDWSKQVTRVIKYRYPLSAYLIDNGKFLIIKNNSATGEAAISLIPSIGVNILDCPFSLQAGKKVRLGVVFEDNAESGEYPINVCLRYKGRKFYKTVRIVKKDVTNIGSMIE